MVTPTTTKAAQPTTVVRPGEKEIDKTTGAYVRKSSTYRNLIKSGTDSTFPAQGQGRYHLYVSYACPWSTRVMLVLNLKGIGQDVIGRSVAHPNYQALDLAEGKGTTKEDSADTTKQVLGWVFDDVKYQNKATHHKTLRAVYLESDPDYVGKWTVPCLFDTHTGKVVNNESSDILAMLNDEFNEFATHCHRTFRPKHLRDEIDRLADWLYPINNGVYQCGFAQSQAAYDEAATLAAERLDECEELLKSGRAYIAGDVLTEADLRLFSTLVRWDSIYFVHFKCCFRRISSDYPFLSAYVRQLYACPEIEQDIPFDYIRKHYYQDHRSCNPHGIVPMGPYVLDDLRTTPHGRGDIQFATYED